VPEAVPGRRECGVGPAHRGPEDLARWQHAVGRDHARVVPGRDSGRVPAGRDPDGDPVARDSDVVRARSQRDGVAHVGRGRRAAVDHRDSGAVARRVHVAAPVRRVDRVVGAEGELS
jgi:hypothetical protein